MANNKFGTFLAGLCEHPCVQTHRGATSDDMQLLLRKLRVRLPKNYVTFLREVGWRDINGDVIFGAGPDVTKAESVWEHSKVAVINYSVPPGFVPICSDGGGSYYCINIDRISGDDCPVVFWDTAVPDPESHRPPKEAPSFFAFLKRLVRDAPEM